MKCEDARERIVDRALGTSGDAKELETHLASCEGCRSEERVVALLKASDADGASETRRARTVAAMVRARDARVPRRRWIAMAAAAGLLVAAGIPFLLARHGLKVERLEGTACVVRGAERVALAVGDKIHVGDRVESEGVLSLEGDRLKIRLNQGSTIRYGKSGGRPYLGLEKGSVRIESSEGPTVLESAGATAVVRGTVEARFTGVGGYPKDPTKGWGFQLQVKKGSAQFEGRTGPRLIEEGQILNVTEEGTEKVDAAPGDPGRKPQ